MKLNKDKNNQKSFRLPLISSKTSTSFSTETSNSRLRPSSSSKVNDLQKNLFAQLNDYDQLDKKKGKKAKTRKQIQSTQDNANDWANKQAPYLKKLEKLIPQTYAKIVQSRKPQPLQDANNLAKPKKLQQSGNIKLTNALQIKQKQKKTGQRQQKGQQSSFSVAEREVQQIFKEYLEKQGIQSMNETSMQDLKELNKQIDSTEADINNLKNSMYEIIRQFGSDCINIQ